MWITTKKKKREKIDMQRKNSQPQNNKQNVYEEIHMYRYSIYIYERWTH